MLKMKSQCESCSGKLEHRSDAYICSYECTFCSPCTESMDHICPNCDGELVKRPARVRSVIDVATTQIKRKVFGK